MKAKKLLKSLTVLLLTACQKQLSKAEKKRDGDLFLPWLRIQHQC